MSVNRELWISEFSNPGHPGWPCPTCAIGILQLHPDTLAHEVASDSHLDEREGEIDTYKAVFSCLFKCGNHECGEPVAVSGTVRLEELPNTSYEFRFIPKSFIPAPRMIRVPVTCPEDINQEVLAAFSLFWLDRAASLNRIRIAIEVLLTSMRISRLTLNKKHKRVPVNLHSRIEKLKKKRPKLSALCDQLLAVKHLGNAGSHAGEVDTDDVFDALDILERILKDIYGRKGVDVEKMVKEINKRKGPRKSK